VASDRCGVHVSFGFLVIPLLIGGPPNLFLTAVPASERFVDVKFRQPPIGVDVIQI
jgi:hypothetical protein